MAEEYRSLTEEESKEYNTLREKNKTETLSEEEDKRYTELLSKIWKKFINPNID